MSRVNMKIRKLNEADSWSFDQRLYYLDSLCIEDFTGLFGLNRYFRQKIKDIKFSNDKKFIFICEIY